MNQKEGAVFLLVLVLFGMHSFFNFFGMSLEKNVHHTLVLTLVKCQCSLIRTLKKKSVLFGSNYLKMSSLVELSSENVLFGGNPL